MQIKTTMRGHLTPARMASIKKFTTVNAGEGVEKREPSCTVGGNVTRYSHYGKYCSGSLKKTKNRAMIWPRNSVLGTHPEKTIIQKDACTHVHGITIYNSQDMKAAKYLSTEEWIKKIWCIHTHTHNIILLRHKKECNIAICTDMNGPKDCHTEWNKSDREKQIL